MDRPFTDVLTAAFGEAHGVAEQPASPTSLDRLRSTLEQVRAGHPEAAAGMIDRITRISAAYDVDDVEQRAAALYDDPAALRRDCDLLLALVATPDGAAELLRMHRYAQDAVAPESDGPAPFDELAIDRRLVLQRLTPDVLLRAPHQLEELSAHFNVYRRRYAQRYVDHHATYHAQLDALRAQLCDAQPTLDALTMLNTIAALGAPAGAALAADADRLSQSLTACDVDGTALARCLEEQPRCPSCALQLGDAPPADAVAAWLGHLRRALQQQQRRLARAMVAQAVSDPDRPAFERFLRALRASEVAPLVETLDAGLLALIREILGEHA